jgi:lysophospholipase L1-like esterase
MKKQWILLLMGLVLTLLVGASPLDSTVAQGEKVDDSYFSSALFIGDSLTEGIKLYDVMSNAAVLSHTGINLDNIMTKQVVSLSNGEKVTIPEGTSYYHPRNIYVLMGANSMFSSQTTFVKGYRRLVEDLKQRHPYATIYVQSVMPVTASYEKRRPEFANSKIDQYNAAVRQMAIEEGVEYLNVAEALKDSSGKLPESASSDGMHFGVRLYRQWFDYLATHVAAKSLNTVAVQ